MQNEFATQCGALKKTHSREGITNDWNKGKSDKNSVTKGRTFTKNGGANGCKYNQAFIHMANGI